MESLIDLVRKIASGIGSEGVRVWPDMAAAYWLKSLTALLAGPLALIVSGWFAIRMYRWADDNGVDDELLYFGALLAGAVCVIMAIVYAIELGGLLAGVFYPEASLIQDLLRRK